MLAGNYPVFKIDLNMLRGDRINTRMKFVEYGHAHNAIKEGAFVYGIDEEDVLYPGVIEAIEGQRVKLRLDMSNVSSTTVYPVSTYNSHVKVSGSAATTTTVTV